MVIKDHCSPNTISLNGTCLTDDLILKIGHILNKQSSSNDNIKYINLKNRDILDIHSDICENISNISNCSNELCWGSIKYIFDNLGSDKNKFLNSFKPMMPKKWYNNLNEWLSTGDIDNCLNQYTLSDKEFKYYGATPIDFDKCSVSGLCSFNLSDHIKNNEFKIGVVFNTDPSTESGEHWISLYIDIKGYNLDGYPGIYYFDSYGNKPPKNVKKLIDKIIKQGKKIDIDFYYFYNDKSYQKANYQCGMYSIYFITTMIKKISFLKFLLGPLKDKHMKELRKHFFIKL
jgi:hypothetical protein